MITDTEKTEFETVYRRLLGERYGNALVTPAQELVFCRELKRGAQLGDVPHGAQVHHVVPADIDYTSPATIAAVRRPQGLSLPQLVVLSALSLAFVAYLVMTVTGMNKPAAASSRSEAAATPTRTAGAAGSIAAPTQTSLPVPTVPAGFVTVAGETLPAVRPNTLELGGRSFLVYVAPVRDGNWYVRQEPGIANWVPGSILNWSFALYVDSDPGAAAWSDGLQPGQEAILRVADGRALQFSIVERNEINRSQIEFLDPHRPGLTVAIKYRSGDSRLLVRATEVAAGVPDIPATTPTP